MGNSLLTSLDMKLIEMAKQDNVEKGILICAVLAIREYDLSEEVEGYLLQHPNASFMEIDEFIIKSAPSLEILDG